MTQFTIATAKNLSFVATDRKLGGLYSLLLAS